MTLRSTLQVYLLTLHIVVAGVLALLLWPSHRIWILGLEGGLVLSGVFGMWLVRTLKMPDDLARIGIEWMRDGEFAHTVRPSGTDDLRELVDVFNELFHRLRDERLQVEERNLLLDKLMKASPSGMVMTDHDRGIHLMNPAASTLLDSRTIDVVGRTVEEVFPVVEGLALGESRVVAAAGGRRMRWSRAEFFDRGFSRELFLVEDLTHELWETEKRAYHSLIRTLSHEVNNTLGATGSILRSLLAYEPQLRIEDRKDFSAALEVASDRGDNLVAFMKRYAEVVRIPKPVKCPTSAVELVRKMVLLFGPECEDRGIEVRWLEPKEDLTVLMDGVQIEQVLVNIFRNACEAVGKDGWISIHLEALGDGMNLEIRDSGPGLDPEARRHLFMPFFSTKATGQGVGLTLVRVILTLHGWNFDLESDPEQATRFWIQSTR